MRVSGVLAWHPEVAMNKEEIDEFLSGRWIARLATIGTDGYPHIAPLWYYWDGESLAKVNKIAESPIACDMPYGPEYSDLPHQNGIVVVYADGHSKYFRLTDRELPTRPGGNWWDLVHQAAGQ